MAILAIPFYLSEQLTDKIPMMMNALVPALFINGYAQSFQELPIKELMSNGSKNYSTRWLLGIVVLAILSQIFLVVSVAALSFLFL